MTAPGALRPRPPTRNRSTPSILQKPPASSRFGGGRRATSRRLHPRRPFSRPSISRPHTRTCIRRLFGDTLIARLSGRLGVGDDQVLVGAGSLALLQQVLTAYTGPGTEVVYPWRSYEAYPILIGIAGASGVPVALDSEHRHDLSAMAAAVTPQTRAVLVCNPNNPTGSEFSTAEFVAFARAIPSDVLILLDEAYREFATSDVDGVDLLRTFPNIVVFPNLLQGLRIGRTSCRLCRHQLGDRSRSSQRCTALRPQRSCRGRGLRGPDRSGAHRFDSRNGDCGSRSPT